MNRHYFRLDHKNGDISGASDIRAELYRQPESDSAYRNSKDAQNPRGQQL